MFPRFVCAAALLASSPACGSTSPGTAAIPPPSKAETDPTVAALGELTHRMASAGLKPGRIRGRGFITGGQHHTVRIKVPVRACLAIVAFGSRGIRDLDATLLSPDGDVLTEDVEPDPQPLVRICGTNTPHRAYYSLHAYNGSGSFVFTSFVGPRAAFRSTSRAGSAASLTDVQAHRVRGGDRFAEFSRGLGRRGFRLLPGSPADVPLAEGQAVRLPLQSQRGRCYAVAAFPGSGADDVTLRVHDELGEVLAHDTLPSPHPAAQLCVDRDANLSVEVSTAGATQTVRVAMWTADSEKGAAGREAWLGSRGPLAGGAAVQPLSSIHPDWSVSRTLEKGTLSAGEATRIASKVRAGRCHRWIAKRGPALTGLALRVTDAHGALLASGSERNESSWATVCSEQDRNVRVALLARRGYGKYELREITRGGVRPEFAASDWADQGPLLDVVELDPTRWRRRAAETPIPALALRAGHHKRVAIPLAGRCAAVRVVARGEDGRVYARLLRGGRVEAYDAGRIAKFLACPKEGSLSLEITGDPGTTAAWLVIYDRVAQATSADVESRSRAI